jgi:hypothetical protein
MKNSLYAVFAAILTLTSCGTDNGETPVGNNKQIMGHIEKGPFVQGSEVTLSDLDKTLSQTGKSSQQTLQVIWATLTLVRRCN